MDLKYIEVKAIFTSLLPVRLEKCISHQSVILGGEKSPATHMCVAFSARTPPIFLDPGIKHFDCWPFVGGEKNREMTNIPWETFRTTTTTTLPHFSNQKNISNVNKKNGSNGWTRKLPPSHPLHNHPPRFQPPFPQRTTSRWSAVGWRGSMGSGLEFLGLLLHVIWATKKILPTFHWILVG